MSRKVLIVDDDPNALRLVSYAFQQEGYQTSTAATGAEALACLARERPDLIVLDVMMPDMSGLEVCQRIRASRQTARLPILMLSARGQVADRVSGLKSGADDYLPKPADTSELLARAEALLARASYSARAAEVLAFLGVKGGVGTTTVAVNVGAHMASLGKSVCLVELRTAIGTAGALLRLQPTHHLGELLAIDPGQLREQDVLGRLIHHASGLRLLAAPQTADGPCEISAAFAEALLDLLPTTDYILLDLPASWSAANRAVVRRARYTALIGEPYPLAVQCARATLATLRNWGIMGDLVGLVMVNQGQSPAPLTLPALRSQLEANVVASVPPAAEVCQIAGKEGVPLVTLQPQHIAARALRDLAERLMAEPVVPASQQLPTG